MVKGVDDVSKPLIHVTQNQTMAPLQMGWYGFVAELVSELLEPRFQVLLAVGVVDLCNHCSNPRWILKPRKNGIQGASTSRMARMDLFRDELCFCFWAQICPPCIGRRCDLTEAMAHLVRGFAYTAVFHSKLYDYQRLFPLALWGEKMSLA